MRSSHGEPGAPGRLVPCLRLLLPAAILASALAAAPAAAQLEDNLASYTDDTAEGYLKPLAEAFGQNLNTGFFTSAAIPRDGFRVRLEVHAMSVFFSSDDETFEARTGGDFVPAGSEETFTAPTVVGSEQSVEVPGQGGTAFIFPGGFDLGSFTLAVPQLTIGNLYGTEAAVRWIGVDTGDAELGDIDLLGLGVRHSISQYFENPPLDLAGSVFWQKFRVGDDDLIDATAFSFGVQASRAYGVLEPFGSLTLDTFSMTSEYTVNEGEEDEDRIQVDLETEVNPHFLLGLGVHLGLVHFHVAGNVSDRLGLSGGLAIGL